MANTRLLTKYRTSIQSSYDCLCWLVALAFALWLRLDLRIDGSFVRILELLPVVVFAQIAAGMAFGMYRGRWQFGSFDEALALGKGIVLTTGAVYLANLAFEPFAVPRSVPLGAGLAALLLMAGGRYFWRMTDERRRRPQGADCERLLVFGAGEGGTQIIRAMLSDRDSRYVPVAVLDDDSTKRNLRIRGVPVVGGREKLAAAATQFDADALLIAIPSAEAPLVTELSELAVAAVFP